MSFVGLLLGRKKTVLLVPHGHPSTQLTDDDQSAIEFCNEMIAISPCKVDKFTSDSVTKQPQLHAVSHLCNATIYL